MGPQRKSPTRYQNLQRYGYFDALYFYALQKEKDCGLYFNLI